jgi:hypothetical protein
MLTGMTNYPRYTPSYYSVSDAERLRQQRQTSHALGTVGRVILITAAVVLVLGGLALVGCIVLFIVGMNSYASNK